MTSLATQNGTKLWRTTALQKSNGKAIQQMSSTCCHHQRHGIIPWRNLRSSTAWEHISNKWRFKPIPRKGTTLMPSEAFNHLKWPMKQSIYIGKAKAQVQQWHLLTTQRPIQRLSCPPRERKIRHLSNCNCKWHRHNKGECHLWHHMCINGRSKRRSANSLA